MRWVWLLSDDAKTLVLQAESGRCYADATQSQRSRSGGSCREARAGGMQLRSGRAYRHDAIATPGRQGQGIT